MIPHRIPLAKVHAHLRFRSGELTLRRAVRVGAAQDFYRETIPDACRLITTVWIAGATYARGLAAGGHMQTLSEPCDA